MNDVHACFTQTIASNSHIYAMQSCFWHSLCALFAEFI